MTTRSWLGLLGWLYLVVLWLTWTPTGSGPPEILLALPPMSWVVILGNLLLFAPIGWVLGTMRGAAKDGPSASGGPVVVATMVVLILSILVELGQLRVPGRSVSPYDVVLNTAGAAAAAWVAVKLVRSGMSGLMMSAGAGAAVLAGVVIFLSSTGFAAGHALRLFDWHGGYPVLAGEEADGGREYLGTVSEARICAGLPREAVCLEPGASARDRRRVAIEATERQRVLLSATVASAAPQNGPGRIVTYSSDSDHRNAMLGQENRDLVFRVRTPLTGPNASNLEFVLASAVAEDTETRVWASFTPGRIRIVAGADGGAVSAAFVWGFFSSWRLLKHRESTVEPSLLFLAGLVGAASFSLPLGLALGFIGRLFIFIRAVGSLLLPPILMILLASPLGAPVAGREVVASAAFGLMGFLLGVTLPTQVRSLQGQIATRSQCSTLRSRVGHGRSVHLPKQDGG